MKKFIFIVAFILSIINKLPAQPDSESHNNRPKLIVGIVVDQMAYDFLYRYMENYSDDGFKKLLNKGFSCENANFNYIPTYTGPGHTSVYTGSVPAVHGIVSNDWYDKNANVSVYCSHDNTVNTIGSTSTAGQMSPRNMLVTTICDELKLFHNMHSKVVGIALKDRGAILPAGHLADAAYWYDGYSNAWVTSSYYMQQLPAWVVAFNNQNKAAAYLSQPWDLLLQADAYKNSTADNVAWEGKASGESAPVFPHVFTNITNTEAIKATPYGNSFTADFAIAALKNEALGKDAYTDFLAVSFSSTDYVGHRYGNYALEMEDTYIRLDRTLASFIKTLDTEVGDGNYVLFLTADHGVATAPLYAKHLNIPAGYFFENNFKQKMDSVVHAALGREHWIKAYTNQNIYLNDSLLTAKNKTSQDILRILQPWLLNQEGVANVFLVSAITQAPVPEKIKQLFINGMYQKRNGDIFIQYEPNWMDMYGETGTTHGSHYSYDTHVPLLWYGWGIKQGYTNRYIPITDIAPTIAAMLHIRQPNGCIGDVITELR
jgi:predicted AlkP superfamily pyrophosphatase or phosphodiesterase